jgi:hypothetical protein
MYRGILAAGLLAFAAGGARADDDVIRLAIPEAEPPALTLSITPDSEEAETVATRYYGGRGYYGGGGYRGYRGGFYGGGYRGYGYRAGYRGYYGYRGYGYRGYAGYRAGYYGYRGYGYRGYGYGGYGYRAFYRPWYGYGYGGYGYAAYPSYYYAYPAYSYYACADTSPVIAPITTLAVRPTTVIRAVPTPAPAENVLPKPTPAGPKLPPPDGGFEYNGGPREPMPMPPAEEEQVRELPRIPTPVVDRLVSLPAEPKTGKWAYPAYGEAPRRTGR